jgi:hypothetical protein
MLRHLIASPFAKSVVELSMIHSDKYKTWYQILYFNIPRIKIPFFNPKVLPLVVQLRPKPNSGSSCYRISAQLRDMHRCGVRPSKQRDKWENGRRTSHEARKIGPANPQRIRLVEKKVNILHLKLEVK